MQAPLVLRKEQLGYDEAQENDKQAEAEAEGQAAKDEVAEVPSKDKSGARKSKKSNPKARAKGQKKKKKKAAAASDAISIDEDESVQDVPMVQGEETGKESKGGSKPKAKGKRKASTTPDKEETGKGDAPVAVLEKAKRKRSADGIPATFAKRAPPKADPGKTRWQAVRDAYEQFLAERTCRGQHMKLQETRCFKNKPVRPKNSCNTRVLIASKDAFWRRCHDDKAFKESPDYPGCFSVAKDLCKHFLPGNSAQH